MSIRCFCMDNGLLFKRTMEGIQMKRAMVILWILLLSGWQVPEKLEIEMLFDNGSWISESVSNLTLRANQPVEAYLYLNNQQIREISQEDFVFDQEFYVMNLKIEESGWYVLYDKAGQYLCEAVLVNDDDVMMTTHKPWVKRVENRYLLNQETEIAWLAKKETHAFDGMQTTKEGNWELYTKTINEEGLIETQFNKEKWQFYLDTTPPQLTINLICGDKSVVMNEPIFYTDQSNAFIQIERIDEADLFFEPEKEWRQNKQCLIREIRLKEGENLVDEVLLDQAGHPGQKPIQIILDTEPPQIQMPENEIIANGEIKIEDLFLDWNQTMVTLDGIDQKSFFQQTNHGYELSIQKSGEYVIKAKDRVGHLKEVSKKIIFDDQPPKANIMCQEDKLYLNIEEEHLPEDFYREIILNNKETLIPFEKDGNLLVAQIDEDGYYSWQGSVTDLAGNMLEINLGQVIDVQTPRLTCDYRQQDFYEEPITIHFNLYDQYMAYWYIDLYRNDQWLKRESGNASGQVSLILDDQDFGDGHGLYKAFVYASDGCHEKVMEKTWIMDSFCAPIEVSVNGVNASKVEKMDILRPMIIHAVCQEGIVSWQLFKEDTLLKNGTQTIELQPSCQATHLVMYVKDPYGHETTKTLLLETPIEEPLLSFFDGTQRLDHTIWQMQENQLTAQTIKPGYVEVYVDGEKTYVNEKTDTFDLPVKDTKVHNVTVLFKDENDKEYITSLQVVGAKQNHFWFIFLLIGGGMLAIASMRRYKALCIRNKRNNDNHLLDTETVAIASQEESTRPLS